MATNPRRLRYGLGAAVFLAFASLTIVNEKAVVRADDEYCSYNHVSGECDENQEDKCTAHEGYRCFKQLGHESCSCGIAAE
ncbi:MAG TPA: hypothetical protein VJN96_12185 [Vicinamibacterales bacterium]|nr:hypothetical protein [Vicinamibacterales bacterium]